MPVPVVRLSVPIPLGDVALPVAPEEQGVPESGLVRLVEGAPAPLVLGVPLTPGDVGEPDTELPGAAGPGATGVPPMLELPVEPMVPELPTLPDPLAPAAPPALPPPEEPPLPWAIAKLVPPKTSRAAATVR